VSFASEPFFDDLGSWSLLFFADLGRISSLVSDDSLSLWDDDASLWPRLRLRLGLSDGERERPLSRSCLEDEYVLFESRWSKLVPDEAALVSLRE
jgi:hypothetical protein